MIFHLSYLQKYVFWPTCATFPLKGYSQCGMLIEIPNHESLPFCHQTEHLVRAGITQRNVKKRKSQFSEFTEIE